MPKTILLADDSVTIQKVVAISFASEDVTVLTVRSARPSREIPSSHRFRCCC